MKYFLPFCMLALLTVAGCKNAPSETDAPLQGAVDSINQSPPRPGSPPLAARLYEAFEQYREPAITNLRFKHSDITALLDSLPPEFEVTVLGASVEGRSISEVQLGEGPTPVLLWSQMHGDEPTATMAIMDIFNFFQARGDGFDSLRAEIKEALTLHFIPMLNPDGAERYQRRNVLDVDLNRDALRLQSPESKILKAARDRTQAVWGFNLHDKNRYYAAGDSPETASVSFLAPAFNTDKDINEGRADAMQLIVLMDEVLQQYIPGKTGRYDDTFEPRAFGDNMQKWGTNTVLIESGGLKGDREKQYLRRLHFTILLTAFEAMANGTYENWPREAYEDIPYNESGDFHDLIIRNANRLYESQSFLTDLAFRHREIDYQDARKYYLRGSLTDLGDMSTYHGYEEFDAAGYTIVPGKVYAKALPDVAALRQTDLQSLVRQGYTDFQITNLPHSSVSAQWPVALLAPGKQPNNTIYQYGNPSFLLEKAGQYDYVVVNGFIYSLLEQNPAFDLPQ
ncbi:MAG: M14 family zinc carboxypeptidase [Phaeodactylibacter sp.]|uniref:M14 family zinc carboxypeptidase n=1 Tax=Phaeodactylibacter sp. TaxID=1940289 RepID=UPI0032EEC341